MIALDTNVLIRFLVRDDDAQSRRVLARFKQAEAAAEILFVPLVVVLETIWVLESAYGKSRQEILDALEDLRRMRVLRFEEDRVIEKLLAEGRRVNADLSDLLIALVAQENGCSSVLTFDRNATRLPLFSLLR